MSLSYSKVYIYYLNSNLSEGGMSRNSAFYKNISTQYKSVNVFTKTNFGRIIMMLEMFWKLMWVKNSEIFIHQGAILFIFPVSLLKYSFYKNFFGVLMHRVSQRNKLTIEVNDLPYEQSIDLGLEVKPENKIFQKIILGLNNVRYIFASKYMLNFAAENYNLDKKTSIVIINGAPLLHERSDVFFDFFKDRRMKFVYSGTLNKGRNMEELIEIFKNQPQKILILIGPNGEWIRDEILLPENILYLGSFNEKEAHQIVASCDVGLMHYDEKKLYYNICFPTKASFYAAAGIAVLSTPMKEIYEEFQDSFMFAKISDWVTFIDSLTWEQVEISKNRVGFIKQNYNWEYIFQKNKF